VPVQPDALKSGPRGVIYGRIVLAVPASPDCDGSFAPIIEIAEDRELVFPGGPVMGEGNFSRRREILGRLVPFRVVEHAVVDSVDSVRAGKNETGEISVADGTLNQKKRAGLHQQT
jgi:hypothetical protein